VVLPTLSLEQLWLHLLVHPELHQHIVAALPSRKLHVRLSETHDQAISAIWQRYPDLLLIEAVDDYAAFSKLCRQIRSFFMLPIIVVEQGCSEAERIDLLDSGADDVVALREGLSSLRVRMLAIARRAERQRQRNPESPYLSAGPLRLDIRGRRLLGLLWNTGSVARGAVDLTLRQTMLLAMLFHHQGGVVSDQALARHMFGRGDAEMVERVTATFEQLRRRLSELQRQHVIERVHNRGYRLVVTH
jgi:DNA-binding response OmpR family regulator